MLFTQNLRSTGSGWSARTEKWKEEKETQCDICIFNADQQIKLRFLWVDFDFFATGSYGLNFFQTRVLMYIRFFFLGKYQLWPLCVRHGVTFEQSRSRWPDKTRKQKIEEKTRKKLSRKAHTERDILLWYMSKLYLKDAPPSLSRCAHTSMKRRLLQGERGGQGQGSTSGKLQSYWTRESVRFLEFIIWYRA